jgi:hypothetical protein
LLTTPSALGTKWGLSVPDASEFMVKCRVVGRCLRGLLTKERVSATRSSR